MSQNLKTNMLIGIGHPLLDITAVVEQDFLEKYNLKENNAIIATEHHQNLYKELLEKYPVTYTVGGSIQNTLRIIQWLTETPKLTTFFGSVGEDELSRILFEKATLDGVNVRYQYNDEESTGTCIVLINGENRSLITNPGSSKLFNLDHLKLQNMVLLETAEYFYMGGFFLSVSLDTIKEVSKIAATCNRQFLFNISAPFVCQKYKTELIELMPYIDVIFGNKAEIEALAESFQIEVDNVEQIILTLSEWKKINNTRPRTVVLTQSENPVIVGRQNKITKFPVAKLQNEKVVDTNGAGDAFVGGFLSQYMQRKELDVCVNCGIWAASEIIKIVGCAFEGKASFCI